MNDKIISEKESLAIIQQMVNTSRSNIRFAAPTFLLWGWLVVAASVLNWLLLMMQYEFAFLPWIVLMPIGGIATPFMNRARKGDVSSMSFIVRMLVYIYAGFTGPILFAVLLGVMHGWNIAFPLFMLLYGFSGLVSGAALRFNLFIYGGVVAMLIAIVSLFLPSQWHLLTIALAIIFSNIIPAYQLKNVGK